MSTPSDSPFAFSAPPPADSPAPLESPYSPLSLIASSTHPSSPSLLELSQTLLALRTSKAFNSELAGLSGELRDEWRGRVAAVKGDWMARVVPDPSEDDEVENEDGVEGKNAAGDDEGAREAAEAPLLLPTIMSDHDGLLAMSSRVDAIARSAFEERIPEAEARIRKAVLRTETMELEVFLGGQVLQCLEVTEGDEDEASELVADNIRDALSELGWDGKLVKLEDRWESGGAAAAVAA